MFASASGILLGMLMGVRHALEPDHLSAVTTLVAETRDARRSASIFSRPFRSFTVCRWQAAAIAPPCAVLTIAQA